MDTYLANHLDAWLQGAITCAALRPRIRTLVFNYVEKHPECIAKNYTWAEIMFTAACSLLQQTSEYLDQSDLGCMLRAEVKEII